MYDGLWPILLKTRFSAATPLSFLLGFLHHAASDCTYQRFTVTLTFFWQRTLLLLGAAVALAACSMGPQITTTLDVPESADTPYENILIIALFSRFDSRRRLEGAVAKNLSDLGINAVASTSLMNTKTPVTRQTFLAMVEKLDSDAVLVTQLVDIESKAAMKDSASPSVGYNFRSTYYFNVWEVERMEYVDPQSLKVKSSIVVSTELYSVLSREPVWAIQSRSKIVATGGTGENFEVFLDEADAIVKHLSRDGLIAR